MASPKERRSLWNRRVDQLGEERRINDELAPDFVVRRGGMLRDHVLERQAVILESSHVVAHGREHVAVGDEIRKSAGWAMPRNDDGPVRGGLYGQVSSADRAVDRPAVRRVDEREHTIPEDVSKRDDV